MFILPSNLDLLSKITKCQANQLVKCLWVIILTMDTQPASSFRSLHEGTNDTKTQSFVGLILVTKFPRQLKE